MTNLTTKSNVFEIKQGDTGPDLATVLIDSDGDPADLTTAVSVKLSMVLAKHPRTVKLNAVPVTFAADATGAVSYEWGATDTDTVGTFNIEWTAVWGDGFVMTFPSCGFDIVKVNPKA